MKPKLLVSLSIVLFLASTTVSYLFFSQQKTHLAETEPDYSAPVSLNGEAPDTAPKTEDCPLNGKKYSKAKREAWEKRRPLGIMVQNNIDARPQSGLLNADVIYEAVAEGGITRFLAIYYCDTAKIVGSVRSARVYFITLLQGYGSNPLYAHVGGANTPGPADAIGLIKKLKWFGYNDLDQFSVPFPQYWRDYDRLPDRATEHTVYSNTQKLWDFATKKRQLSYEDEDGKLWSFGFDKLKFTDDKEYDLGVSGVNISYYFWENNLSSDYNVEWQYDSEISMYKRANGGKPHMDNNTNKQLASTNVIIVFADESVANDGYTGGDHMLYKVTGTGKSIVFKNGQAITGRWKKPSASDNMKFYDSKNKEIELSRGQIWVSILPSENEVTYK